MRFSCPIRLSHATLAMWLCLGLSATGLRAQSAPPSKPQDNPFPGDAPQTPTSGKPGAQQQGQGSNAKPDANTSKPKSDNPFPGEDPNAPIIPVAPTGPDSSAGSGASSERGPDSGVDSRGDSGANARRGADPDGDPVRSPDPAGNYSSDDGFSSSRAGVTAVPSGDDSNETVSKAAHGKTKAQLIKEDVDVGGFYLDKKNWKAAQARFSAAFVLDVENPDVVWGLAEAERHLQLYKEAAEHYQLFLTYEPDGRRGREARKALEELQAARPAAAKNAGPGGGSPN